jgi:ABC-2 type transport system ATP-binding protein
MLELRRVSKLFAGIPAVYDVSFSAMPSEVTGYLGPNGIRQVDYDEDDRWAA